MPTYEYECKHCEKQVEIDKPMSQAGQRERCSCGKILYRIWRSPQMSLNHWKPDYSRCDDGEKEAIAQGAYE
jgi:putative FmdB family regulatory protein